MGENTIEGTNKNGFLEFKVGGMSIDERLYLEYNRGIRIGIFYSWIIFFFIFILTRGI